MELGIRGKVALLPACSRGIGRAVALELAREGVAIALCGRNAEALEATADDARRAGSPKVYTERADLTEAAAIERFVAAANQALGPADILIINGGGPPPGGFADIDDAGWRAALDAVLLAPIRLARLALPAMQARGWGRIVAISSYSVRQPVPGLLLSNSIRLAVLGWAKSLAEEVAAQGVTVNTVGPGWTATERVQALVAARVAAGEGSAEQVTAAITAAIPVGRLGQPEEIAAMVAFLASQRAGYITGSAITVDGGLVRAP